MKKVLITCPPMLMQLHQFKNLFEQAGIQVTAPDVVQTLSVEELCSLVPLHDAWIIGDDPATRQVFEAGRAGRLSAAVKWGVGTDNVDFAACRDFGIHISHTPGMFGNEVADIALGYVIALARETYEIDRGVRAGRWPKPCGISLHGRTCAVLGFGDIGANFVRRAMACGLNTVVYDPSVRAELLPDGATLESWPKGVESADFLVVTCALNESSRRMVNENSIARMKRGIRIVNVARGPIVDESALESALISGHIHSVALDVFENEPLPSESLLRDLGGRCIFGSHNASNTVDAVTRTSHIAIRKIFEFLDVKFI